MRCLRASWVNVEKRKFRRIAGERSETDKASRPGILQ